MADDIVDDWWAVDTTGKKTKNTGKLDEKPIDLNAENRTSNKEVKQIKRINDETEAKPKKKRRKKNSETEASNSNVDKLGQKEDLTKIMNVYAKLTMSALEREDVSIDVSRIITSEIPNEGLPQFLLTVLPKWKKSIQKDSECNGSPYILVICSSGSRSMELKRSVQQYIKGDFKIAKLFAKHFKIAKHKEFLSKNRTPIGIGTPKRISDLIDLDALNLDNLRCVVIDWNWKDLKQIRINDTKKIQTELLSLLFKHIITLMKTNTKLKIGLL